MAASLEPGIMTPTPDHAPRREFRAGDPQGGSARGAPSRQTLLHSARIGGPRTFSKRYPLRLKGHLHHNAKSNSSDVH